MSLGALRSIVSRLKASRHSREDISSNVISHSFFNARNAGNTRAGRARKWRARGAGLDRRRARPEREQIGNGGLGIGSPVMLGGYRRKLAGDFSVTVWRR